MAKELATKPKREPGEMSVPGTFMPADFEEMMSEGFATIDTIMVGDPTSGKVGTYLGALIGPGAEVEVQAPDGKLSKMPTWCFHPMTKGGGVIVNVTHVMPAPHQVHAACSRIHRQMMDNGENAIVGIVYNGRVQTKQGRQLNSFRVFEKYTK